MNKQTIFSLYKKEMLDIFRDKKTMIIMVLVPLFLYPCMMLGMMLIMSNISKESLEKTYQIGILQCEETAQIEALLLDEEDEYEYYFETESFDGLESGEAALNQQAIDAFINVNQTEDGRVQYEVEYFSSAADSVSASSYVETILDAYRKELRNEIIEEKFGDYDMVLNPVVVSSRNIATIDAGVPVLSMHAPFELVAKFDTYMTYKGVVAIYDN